MDNNPDMKILHPGGESNLPSNSEVMDALITQPTRTVCDTFQGIVHLEWDHQAPVTPFGQLPFFVDFLKTSHLYDDWLNDCPLKFKLIGPAASV